MKDYDCLNKNYSTTRRLIHRRPDTEAEGAKQSETADTGSRTTLFMPEGEGRQGEGGLRSKGYFKRSIENSCLVTVVTVVFNDAKHIEDTIKSVINQTYDNVEYLVIDGGSTDGTLDVFRKYDDQIDYWVSEYDKGIYEAMNKGISLATGGWLNFMNSGDKYFSSDVLMQIFGVSNFGNVDIIYGNNEVRYPNKTRLASAGNISNLWKGSQFCHQSAFIRSDLHKENRYNITNCLAADFEFFYHCYTKGRIFRYLDKTIATVSSGGLSDTNRIDSIVGWWNVLEKKTSTNIYYIWMILKEMVKARLKKIVRLKTM
jgi:glycosyltransferase involved in cell wall biosynthesis